MKLKNKLLLLVLIVLLLIFMPKAVQATYDFNWTYSDKYDGIEITGPISDKITELNIPEKIGEYEVVSISVGAFANCTLLESVQLPDTIKEISRLAFYDCESLESIEFPTNLIEIGDSVFYNCKKLKSVTINNQITELPNGLFCECSSLTEINIPNNITKIEGSVFFHCASLTEINIPDSVKFIGEHAFCYCILLENINLPNNLEYIGEYAFYDCQKIKNITIPASVNFIGKDAFHQMSSLESIDVNENNQFYSSNNEGVLYDKNITQLIYYPIKKAGTYYTIPQGVTAITDGAFLINANLLSIDIPDTVTDLGKETFRASKLKSITIPNGVKTIKTEIFDYCEDLESVIFPNKLETIEEFAFANCTYLSNITLPDSVTNIGEFAFGSCASLTNITLPKKLEKTGNNAFSWCGNLENVVIQNQTTVIQEDCFDHCAKLKTITIPKSVTSIEARAFNECESLTDVYYSGTEDEWNEILIDNSQNLNNYLINATKHFHEHTWNNGAITKPATCTENGIKTYTCTGCSETKTETVIATGHSFDNGKITKEATYDAEGVKTYTCSKCGTTKTEKITKLTRTSIAKITVTGIKDKAYNGKKQTQIITVKLGNKTLKEGTDYTVTYKDNKKVGKATIVITGKGTYTGTVNRTFKINPKGTILKKLTAGKKQIKATWNKQATETTGYEIQYSTNKNFKSSKTSKIKKNKTTSTTINKLKAKKKYYVRIRTYKTVNGKTYYSSWSSSKNVTTKK